MAERPHRPAANADPPDGWVPLSELRPRQKAVLRALRAPQALAHRLMALGVVPGAEVEVVRTAAFGDPLEICVQGARLALRKRDAQWLLVEVVPQKP